MLKKLFMACLSLWIIYGVADALSRSRRTRRRRQASNEEGRWESEGGALRSD